MRPDPEALLELAMTSPNLGSFRSGALDALVRAFDADVGLFATESTSGGERSELGLDEVAGAFRSGWERYGRETRSVQLEAQRAGVRTRLGPMEGRNSRGLS